jgi:hypothetical protein
VFGYLREMRDVACSPAGCSALLGNVIQIQHGM